jgi:hypothetical protein
MYRVRILSFSCFSETLNLYYSEAWDNLCPAYNTFISSGTPTGTGR